MIKSMTWIAIVAIYSSMSLAQNWTGAISSDFNNPANWSQSPQNGDDIVINPINYTGVMAQPIIASNATFSPAGVEISGGGQLTIQANLTTTDRVEVLDANSAIVLNSGNFNVSGGAGNARLIFFDGANFQMTGGNLTVGQRFLFELGAFGVQTGGSVTVQETFAIVDGNVAQSSYYHLQNGSITTLEFGFENEAGTYYPYFQQDGGTLTVNGDFLVLGVTPGAGKASFTLNGGLADFNGIISNDPTSTMNYSVHIKQLTSGVFKMSGATWDLKTGDTLLVTDAGQLHFDGTSTILNNAGRIDGYRAHVVADANITLNGLGYHRFPDLSINNTFNQQVSAMYVNGDFNSSLGQYVPNLNLISFVGDTVQKITIAGNETWYDVELDNTGEGAQLVNGNLTISHSFNWLNGVFDLGNNDLVFIDNATSSNASIASYAIGRVTKMGNQGFYFPVGGPNSLFRPFEISAPVSVATVVKVKYNYQPYSVLTPVNTPLTSVSNLEYWDVQQSGSTDLLGVGIHWQDASASGLVDCASTAMAHFDTDWDLVPATFSGLCNGANSGTMVSMNPLAIQGVFTFGFTQGVYQQAVQLCAGDSLQVGTNYYSIPGIYYDVLTDINGNDSTIVTSLTFNPVIDVSTTNNILSIDANAATSMSIWSPQFQWFDCGTNQPLLNETSGSFSPTVNGSYYVLVTVNGCVDTSACVLIDQLSLSENNLNYSVFPNPSTGVFTLKSSVEIEEVRMIAMDGKELSLTWDRLSDQEIGIQTAVKGMFILRWKTGRNDWNQTRIILRD